MNYKLLTNVFFFFLSITAFSQSGSIKGRIFNSINNESVSFANIVIQGTTQGTTSDIDGNYEITNLSPGIYNIAASYVGFKSKTVYEIEVTNAKPAFVDIAMQESVSQIEEIEITTEVFSKTEESPVSLQTIGVSEIARNPGGNRDISKVIQSLPGVASPIGFRNDIIIRGGSPAENRFYLDGIEVPNINHFSTQGASGGPVGMINVNFIREVDFYSGAFPANRGNTLSSVFEFKQKDGNAEKLETNFTIGSSDAGVTFDTPLGKKTTGVFSYRRSYLQFLFSALNLPFLPTYNDVQYKVKTKFNNQNELTLIGLGALDKFSINTGAIDNITDPDEKELAEYFINNLVQNDQWSYAVGANYKHYGESSYQTIVLSRNHLNNEASKYRNNEEIPENLLLNYASEEIENKFRIENTSRKDGVKFNVGMGAENVTYTNSTFTRVTLPSGAEDTLDFNSSLTFNKLSAFAQVSKNFFNERLALSLGVRTDMATYSSATNNPLEQLSPRFSASYSITPELSFNFNVGRYYQLPAYTVLGFRDNSGELVNKNNDITYIQADHLVAGLEYRLKTNTKISVEGFYKMYDQYPFLTNDSISLANLGADFGVIGNRPAVSTSKGRSYGVELLVQKKLSKGFFGILAYTFFVSEFQDKNGNYIPSSWDNRHVVSVTGGKKFKKDWEVGLKWRYLGGAPYTPYDLATSSLISVWQINQGGILDYNQLNSLRNSAAHQLDLRIDKRFFFDKWSLDIYFDIQNAYNFVSEGQPFLNVVTDDAGNPMVDSSDPTRYETYFIKNTNGNLLPSIGLVVDF